jgi:2-polyprenyl-3-methyl-5-hydroxy-6-metoxy-1,4-benzoquinol methylase
LDLTIVVIGLVIYSIEVLMSEIESQSTDLHTLNPLARFSDRAADYVKYRPSYPAAAIDIILAGLGAAPVVADIGAGTGISARLLADRGARVIAIEPNAAMRTAAVSHPAIESRHGTAAASESALYQYSVNYFCQLPSLGFGWINWASAK